ncbi:MAG: DUF5719 family protein [Actinomycetota bacterium]|nr:DUF5719 family protein [Actinomycetota bacterium]
MTKALLALIIAGLAATVMVVPAPQPPQPDQPAAVDPPSVSVCAVEQGSGRSTSIGIVSTVNGDGQFTVFAGGAPAGSIPFETGASGTAALPVVDVAAIGVAAGLVELPNVDAASASLVLGAESVAHESCLATPAQQTLLAGGSTTSGQEFEIQLMNPYSGQAVVDLTVRSESGLESASQLRAIAVPSRSSVAVDLDELLPGRESLAVAIDTTSGSVMAVGRLLDGSDGALWNAAAPAQDWFVPIPAGGVGEVVISTGVAAEVEFQVDLYGTDGLIEAFEEGVVPAQGEVGLEVSGVGASAFRIVSSQPVAVFLRNVGGGGVAFTTGSTVSASRWLLPGAGLGPGGTGRMVILNAGLEQATVVVTAQKEESIARELTIPAGGVLEFQAVEGNADAYTLRGEGLLVPLWVTASGAATAYAIGVPLIDE